MQDQGAVLFLDDDPDLRETVTDLVQAMFDRECLGLGCYRDLVALGDKALNCSLAILDINLGPSVPSGIDAYDWLHEHRFPGRIVFLTGHAGSHPLVVEASRIGDAHVLTKPISFERLKSVIQGRELQEEVGR